MKTQEEIRQESIMRIKEINGLLKPEDWTLEQRDAFMLGYNLGVFDGNHIKGYQP